MVLNTLDLSTPSSHQSKTDKISSKPPEVAIKLAKSFLVKQLTPLISPSSNKRERECNSKLFNFEISLLSSTIEKLVKFH